MAVVIPTDRPKSVRNRCAIEFWWHFCVVILLLKCYVGLVAFVIGMSEISTFFS